MNLKRFLTFTSVAGFAMGMVACEGDNVSEISYGDVLGDADVVDPSENPAQQGDTLLIDNFEDGDNQSQQGENWYIYDDSNSGAESTIATKTKDSEGYPLPTKADNGSKFVYQVNYTLKKGGYQYDPYVGWGVNMPAADYSKYTAVAYKYKGGTHSVRIEISGLDDTDHFMKAMLASKDWKEVTVKFSDLAQEGWGKPATFNPSKIKAVSFQAKGSDTVDSVFIDDLRLISVAGDIIAPPADEGSIDKQPDLVAKDAVIPDTLPSADVIFSTDLQTKAMKYLDKGVSFTNWLEENKKSDGTFKFGEEDIKLLAKSGFKALRLPVDLDLYIKNRADVLAGTAGDLEIDEDILFKLLDGFNKWTKENNMSLTIDYHEYDNSYNTTSADDPKYKAMMANVWKKVAEHFVSEEREDLFFELLNEPDMSNGAVTSTQWTAAAQGIIDSIRKVDTKRTLLFGDARWYSMDSLVKRTPFTDENIIYVVHTYEPFIFTHQGASWNKENADLKNIPFPYNKDTWPKYSSELGLSSSTVNWVRNNVLNYYKTGNKQSIYNMLYKVKKWSFDNKVPVIVNEFGAYNLRSTAESRLNYLTAMRQIGDELEIPLTHWGYTGGFEVIRGGKLIEGIDKALGLSK